MLKYSVWAAGPSMFQSGLLLATQNGVPNITHATSTEVAIFEC